MKTGDLTCCVVVPAYREAGRIGSVVASIRIQGYPVVVIDDGSDDGTAPEAEAAGATVIRHPVNQGKGLALNTGMRYAREQGFQVAVTLDADGQHDPGEIPKFLETYARTGAPVLVGRRQTGHEHMPLIRKCTNFFMSWLLSRMMGQCIPDTQCGYRLYRCDIFPDIPPESGRFAGESEVLLELAARGIRFGSVPIRTIYGTEKSKINPVTDTIRFFSMLSRYRGKYKKTRNPPH